jgi:hypothetical protein
MRPSAFGVVVFAAVLVLIGAGCGGDQRPRRAKAGVDPPMAAAFRGWEGALIGFGSRLDVCTNSVTPSPASGRAASAASGEPSAPGRSPCATHLAKAVTRDATVRSDPRSSSWSPRRTRSPRRPPPWAGFSDPIAGRLEPAAELVRRRC